MGADCTMYLIGADGYKSENLIDFRDYNLFELLQLEDDIYSSLFPAKRSFPSFAKNLSEEYRECLGYNAFSISAKDFFAFIEQYNPDSGVGWVRKYDAWFYETKGVFPFGMDNIKRYLDEDDILEDYVFFEFNGLYPFLEEMYFFAKNHVPAKEEENYYFCYYFDC